MEMKVHEAAIKVLQKHPEGLSAKEITDEILALKYRSFPAKDPVQIVVRALNRHCIGFTKNYCCIDRFFTASKDKNGTYIYKYPNDSTSSENISGDNFTFPSHQIQAINNSKTSKSTSKSRIMDAENQTVRDLLGKYCFHVPDYQRSYSWKSDNIDAFLDDLFNIVHSSDTEARHFLGAITMAKGTAHHNTVDLIDGQQRMTTIFLFLYVILGEYRSTRFSDKASGRADELLRKLAYLNDDGERTGSRLVLGEFNRAFFDEFIIEGHQKDFDERELIAKAYQSKHEFTQNQPIYDAFNKMKIAVEERLDCCPSEEDAYEYLKALQICVLDRFEIVTMIVEEEADAFLIFETLNDRGLALSSVDLIKNKLFQTFATHPDEFDQMKSAWEEMCDNIENKDDLKKYILHYWRAFKGFASPQTLYKTCREYISANGYNEAKRIVNDLKRLSVYYNGFCNPMGDYPWNKNSELKTTLDDMKKMRYDLTHPIMLAAIEKYPNDEKMWAKTAKLCLNFLIRYINVLKGKASSIEKELSQWACSSSFSIEMLRDKFTEKAPDGLFKDQLLTLSMPYTQPVTHYLLCVYEADGCGRKEIWTTPGRGNNTVEHILPQTVNPSTTYGKYWISQFGSLENCDTYKDRLGNYAFLTKPAQGKALNKDFNQKKLVYSQDTDMKLTQELTKCTDWNLDEINRRQERMVDVWVKSISFSV